MGSLLVILVIFGFVAFAIAIGTSIAAKFDKVKRLEQQLHETERQFVKKKKQLEDYHVGVLKIAEQKAIGFPWLAEAYAEYNELEELRIATDLQKKSHPAFKAAAEVRAAATRRRVAEREARILKYQIKYYETLFPWLEELKSEDIEDELIQIHTQLDEDSTEDDPARKWLTAEEYSTLPNQRKYQLALERYWTKKKSKWEIGRDYERYIGYLYESKNFHVNYQGIIEGFDDLGRDLICFKDSAVHIVQCKCWSRERPIHEKHIFQLYGTCVAFSLENPKKAAEGHFITSTTLTDRAKKFADHLNIKITDNHSFSRYPCIKCNISKRSKEKIYHLPFDQQYDRTHIDPKLGEKYVSTVEEAEQAGFRRAFRYSGK